MIIMSADKTVAVNSNLVPCYIIARRRKSGANTSVFSVEAHISDNFYIKLNEYNTVENARAELSRLVNILGDEYNGVEVVQ